MHQYPRPPPSMASPANSDQTNPTRTNNPRDRDVQALRTTSNQGSGSSEDFTTTKQESTADNNPNSQMQRLNQVIQNFHTKAVLIILHSRVELAEAYSSKNNEKRVNRWFNIELDETDDYNDDIRRWRKCDLKMNRPPPLVVEIYLTHEPLAQGQRLVILDEDQKRWDISTALASVKTARSRRRPTDTDEVLLERWTIELGEQTASLPSDLTSILPLVYKKSIVFFRSLYTCCNFLPTWKLSRKVGRSRHNMAMRLGYRILDGSRMAEYSRMDSLETPLCDSEADVTTTYDFGVTDSPAGQFSVKVKYRDNCDFRIDDTEELLSSRFLGADEDLFHPSLPQEDQPKERTNTQVGSLPTDSRRHLLERPELGHAYGSLSTFHQAGFSPGTSPLSALRSARELGQPSPSPEQTRPTPQVHGTSLGRTSLRAVAAGRRSSGSIQPFKAPTLSASPLGASPLAGSPRTSTGRIPTLGSLSEEGGLPPPNAQAIAARRSVTQVPEQPVPTPSVSSSPRPTPVRYSSSFSHRRSRPSLDRISSKPDDDQNSSGKGSTASSAAPPGSGLIAEPPTEAASSGSMQDDEENISDFLNMLDLKKDRSGKGETKAADAAARRTALALNRYHRMRDTNTELSDSLSSSFLVQRSSQSSSRQLPLAAGQSSASGSSSPGKAISPHAPHTPFAPSRLSAAYSHEDAEAQALMADDSEASPDATLRGEPISRDRSSTTIPAIDIPNSPGPFLANFRRSSSAQRLPLSPEDDIGDLYGMRSASMGAKDRKPARSTTSGTNRTAVADKLDEQDSNSPQRQIGGKTSRLISANKESSAADLDSNRSSANNAYRYNPSRRDTVRSVASDTPPPGSSSSFAGTNVSAERGENSGGSGNSSWVRGVRSRHTTRSERPGILALVDDDEFLPFAIDKSDFQAVNNKDRSVSER